MRMNLQKMCILRGATFAINEIILDISAVFKIISESKASRGNFVTLVNLHPLKTKKKKLYSELVRLRLLPHKETVKAE